MKSARKRHFRNVWVGGGGFAIFQRSTTHWTVHTNMARHRSSSFIQNNCHRPHSFFQAGTASGQTSPCASCMWPKIHVARPWWGASFEAKTGQQKWWPQRSSQCHAPCGSMQVAVSGRYGAFWPGYQAHAETPPPTLHPQSEPFCTSTAFVVHLGKQQPLA